MVRDHRRIWFGKLLLAIACAMVWGGVARADDKQDIQEMKARLDRLEKQNAELLKLLGQQAKPEVQQVKQTDPPSQAHTGNNPKSAAAAQDEAIWKAVQDALKKAKDDETKRKKDDDEKKTLEGTIVGKDLKLNATWTNTGLMLMSADEAFKFHFAARVEFDTVWWQQPDAMQALPPIGVGPLDDGFFARRARLEADGTMWEVVEWQTEFNFENANQIAFNHLWAGVKEVPFIGTIRAGQQRPPQGLESFSSSKFTEFMERAAKFEAFEQGFALGIFTAQDYCDRRITTQSMFHRNEYYSNPVFQGASFGDGTYAGTGRITCLPVWKNNGRCFLHLGGSYQYAETPLDRTVGAPLASAPDIDEPRDVIRFRARPELRDNTGVGAFQGNPARWVDTGVMIADNVQIAAAELLVNMGPWWIQAENDWTQVQRAYVPASAAAQPAGNPIFTGGYIATGVFLTGETRGYDRRFGRIDRIIPNSNFFCLRDESGGFNGCWGAWEVAYRFSYVDLDSGAIHGGQMLEHTFGINWYLNPNLRVMANYLIADRQVDAPQVGGWVNGFGMRTCLNF